MIAGDDIFTLDRGLAVEMYREHEAVAPLSAYRAMAGAEVVRSTSHDKLSNPLCAVVTRTAHYSKSNESIFQQLDVLCAQLMVDFEQHPLFYQLHKIRTTLAQSDEYRKINHLPPISRHLQKTQSGYFIGTRATDYGPPTCLTHRLKPICLLHHSSHWM